MSVDWYMRCSECAESVHIAQDGLGGFTLYYGDIECMRRFESFLEKHTLCRDTALEMVTEEVVYKDDEDEEDSE